MYKNAKAGECVYFQYDGGSNPGATYVKVSEFVQSNYLKGIDLMDGEFKRYSYDKMWTIYLLAATHRETHRFDTIHPNADNLTPKQLLDIFKIIYPNKKNVSIAANEAPFIICDKDSPRVIADIGGFILVNSDGNSITIPLGDLTVDSLSELKSFIEKVTL